MAQDVERGQIWMYEFRPPDKRRPVLVLTRPALLKVLRQVIVAPITSTLRETDTEVRLGIDVGLKHDSAVNLTIIETVDRTRLRQFVGTVGDDKMREVCRALNRATGCA